MAKKQNEEQAVEEAAAPKAPVLSKEEQDESDARPANYEAPKPMIVPRVKLHREFAVFWDADAPLKLNDDCTLKPGKSNRLTEAEFRRLRNQVKVLVELPVGLVPGGIYLASNRLVVV